MATYYVDTGSGGGDGTTPGTGSGGTNAYVSISAAEAARVTGTLTEPLIIQCDRTNGGGADSTSFTIDGAVTSASNYIEIVGNPSNRHSGVYNSSLFVCTGGYNSINDNYVRLTGLQFSRSENYSYVVQIQPNTTGYYRISYCVFSLGSNTSGVSFNEANQTADIFNNVFINVNNGGGAGAAIAVNYASATVYIFNNTFHGCALAISRSFGSVMAINNVFSANTADCSGTFIAGTNYNSSTLSSIGYTVTGGGNANDAVSQTFSFTNEASHNFGLVSDIAGVDSPTLNSGSFTDDVTGYSRSSTWSRGAFEFVSGATTLIPVFMNQYRQRRS